jgi:two-component system, NarL family, nitrate/nitrite response regulator NarL
LRVLLVEDQALFRNGLRLTLRNFDSALDFFEASSCAEAAAFRDQSVDLILLDLGLPDLSKSDALKAIRETFPTSVVVVLSGEDNPEIIRRMINEGASGYIPKDSTPEVMFNAIQLILGGGVYIPATMLQYPVPEINSQEMSLQRFLHSMSARQESVFKLLVRGVPNKIIARELNVSEGTIKSHLSTIYRILNVRSRTEAVLYAAKVGYRPTTI